VEQQFALKPEVVPQICPVVKQHLLLLPHTSVGPQQSLLVVQPVPTAPAHVPLHKRPLQQSSTSSVVDPSPQQLLPHTPLQQ